MAVLPMFPLGSVLVPGMPLSLRVFEPRYLELLRRVLVDDGEFGVVLIERGSEVGGGDHRFAVGTTARVLSVVAEEGWIGVTAVGERRFEVVRWLAEDPFPLAEVDVLPEPTWSADLEPAFAAAERAVRRALFRASEFGTPLWPADAELSDDPRRAAWQLAGIAPVGSLDRLSLLRATSLGDLLAQVRILAEAAAETAELSDLDGLWARGDDPPVG